jgi:hypothetical protein
MEGPFHIVQPIFLELSLQVVHQHGVIDFLTVAGQLPKDQPHILWQQKGQSRLKGLSIDEVRAFGIC